MGICNHHKSPGGTFPKFNGNNGMKLSALWPWAQQIVPARKYIRIWAGIDENLQVPRSVTKEEQEVSAVSPLLQGGCMCFLPILLSPGLTLGPGARTQALPAQATAPRGPRKLRSDFTWAMFHSRPSAVSTNPNECTAPAPAPLPLFDQQTRPPASNIQHQFAIDPVGSCQFSRDRQTMRGDRISRDGHDCNQHSLYS